MRIRRRAPRWLSRSLPLALAGLPLLAGASFALPYSIASRTDHAVGAGPEWSIAADVNSDGRLDILTANYLGDSVSVLLADSTGGLSPAVDYPAGAGPFTLVAWDLDNDQILDLVVANHAGNGISVLKGTGGGAFSSPTFHAAGNNTATAAVGYLNSDWFVDIVTANFGSSTLSVFYGDGSGGFTSRVDIPTGTNPNWVATRDLDADGDWDLVTANHGASTMSVHLADGLGGFAPRVDYAVGANPLTLTLADFDGDGVLDVATADYSANTITRRLGDGLGGFGPPQTLATGTGPVTVASGDLNVDGFVDLAVCNDLSGTVSVFLGNGANQFAPRTDYAVGSAPYSIAIGDVTNDGEPDLVACNFGSNSISLLAGDVPGGFAVDDTVAALTAPDQDGVARALSDYLGKWTLIDVSAAWCGPCNFIAKDARQVRDTWLTAGTLPFEYVTSLVEGVTPNRGSTQQAAQRWATRYQLQSPVLHADGRYHSAIRSWFEALGTNAYPTLLLVDPAGKIRWKFAGALGGQDLVDQIASIAGVPAPTLVGPPPPLPPPPSPAAPRPAWQVFQSADIEISYGGVSWLGSLGAPAVPGWTESTFEIQPEGVPGIPNTAYVRVSASVDSTADVESITVFIGTLDVFQSIELSQPWEVKLKNIGWPDGAPRVLDIDTKLSLSAIYPEPGTGADVYVQTQLQPLAGLSGTEIAFSSFTLENVAGVPAATNAFEIGTVRVKHQFAPTLAVGRDGAAADMASPWPNPARGATTLRWAMSRTAPARLIVVDVGGRRVRTLHDGVAQAGEHRTAWDLRNDAGVRLAPGLYFVRFSADGEPARTSRLVVLD